ncbi:PAS domain-containing sensor histidine kinase [Edaphobacter aggregans]|uniref:PAS domain-containing sensor histidine kinase n=1 Tax=Edaphobacter aggregans TaxID=570835 RepID=UPI00068E3561|nr:PAS domain-containing hybrid sensor histidine kinase/response regulator [Edaphobacter aggregans]
MKEDIAKSSSLGSRPVANNRYWRLLEAAPDGIVEVDDSGRIVLLNSQVEKMFGYRREELLGKSVEMLMPERFRGRHPAHREQYRAHSVIRPMGSGLDLRAVRADGTEFAVDINISPFEGETGGSVVCAIRDVTDRRLAEEEIRNLNLSLEQRTRDLAVINSELEVRNRQVEKADRLKSNFLTTMSHELRTPLNAIVGFADLLARQTAGPLTQKQERFVGNVKESSRHLLSLVDDILDISKIEAGCLDLKFESFSLSVAVDEVLSTLRPLAAAKEIDLTTDLSVDLTLHADRLRVRQVLYNLLSNAIKFTPAKGSVRLVSRANGSVIHISVIDTGIGIPPEENEKIFEVFHRYLTPTQHVCEGTGLGLSITRLLVEQHGGKIWVESEPGKGSQFHLTMPGSRDPVR